jgi:hypothetical protein
VVDGSTHIGANGLRDECLWLMHQGRGEERLYGRSDPIDDGANIGRLMWQGLTELVYRRRDRPALAVPQDDGQPRAKAVGRKLHAADLRRRHDVSSHADNEQVAKSLPKDQLGRHPGIGAAQHNRKRRLPIGARQTIRPLHSRSVAEAGDKPTVAVAQP